MKLQTLRKRREFLRVRGGGRWSTHAFVMEAKQRSEMEAAATTTSLATSNSHDGPRFGFTVTKRLGNAVRRNRIRRRLKAALQLVAKPSAKNHFDYVLIARPAAYDMAFTDLSDLLQTALERVHRPKNVRRPRKNTESSTSSGQTGNK